jgi:hydroxyacylglutathione hydrolase
MGWFISYDEPFILIAAKSQLNDLTRKLMRIGMDNFYGYLDAAQLDLAFSGQLVTAQMADLQEVIHNETGDMIDLRGAAEYNTGHISGAKHVFVGTLLQNLDEIPKNRPVIIHCQGGDRSAIAYSLLVKNGYSNVRNFSGGINEWVKEQQPLVS